MARFASRFGKYSHGVRNARLTVSGYDPTGREIKQEIVRELMAVFTPARQILTEHEIQIAIKDMVHKGLPQDRDTEELFSPRSRISGFDSFRAQDENNWTDEERELVEETLRKSHHFGTDHIELIPEPAVRPWPTFDTDDPELIVAIARATGQVEAALAYERENQSRTDLIESLEEAPQVDTPITLDAS